MLPWPSWLGLAIAFGGTLLLVSPAQRALGPPDRLRTQLLDQIALWTLFAAVLAVVLVLENRPLASIGLRPFSWHSLAWGLALAAFLMWIVAPLNLRLLHASGLAGFDAGIADFVRRPPWLQVWAVIGAGVVEETLFRGFAIERLAEASGSYLVAGALALTAFALLHLPMWGWGPVLTFFVSGAVLTAFYLWRHDLLANTTAHILVDTMGLILLPRRTSHRATAP